MSKYDGDIRAAVQGPVDGKALFTGAAPLGGTSDRRDALAHYLSAGDGWNDRSAALGGRFPAASGRRDEQG